MKTTSAVWFLICAAAVLSLMTSCNYQVTGYGPQPKTISGPFATRVIIYPHWVKDVDEIPCRSKDAVVEGCAKLEEFTPGEWRCDLYAQAPTDFDDAARLVTLGHETYHCFGASHQ